VAWLERGAAGCTVRVRTGNSTRTLASARGGCLLTPPAYDLALARGRAAWGGYVEVRCSEFTAAVYGPAFTEEIAGDCLGYRTSFRGLATDGRDFYYSLLDTKPPGGDSPDCGSGGGCRWQLAGGRVMRIAGSRSVPVAGLPAAALIAGAPGRLALVAPARTGSSGGEIDWPRAATIGKVEIRDPARRRVVASFRPRGIVRAVALGGSRAVVLVQQGGRLRIEWYDAGRGVRLGSKPAPARTTRALSTDGHYVAFAAGNTVRALDLETRRQRIVRRAASEPLAVSVLRGQVVWAEHGARGGRVLATSL
jgi:hypothetical protein